jgi:hypothetical protein
MISEFKKLKHFAFLTAKNAKIFAKNPMATSIFLYCLNYHSSDKRHEQSTSFRILVRAGIVDKDGNLTEITGNEDDEITYRYPRGRKNINKSVY